MARNSDLALVQIDPHDMKALTATDIDDILNEIEANEQNRLADIEKNKTKNETKLQESKKIDQSQPSKIKKSISRIEQMEQKFQCLKNLYHKNLQSLTDKIKMELKNSTSNEQKAKKIKFLKTLYQQNLQSFAGKIKKEVKKRRSITEQKASDQNPASTANPQPQYAQFDDAETLKIKIKKLATLIKKSKHFVAFTGEDLSNPAQNNNISGVPTISHMSLVGLMQNGSQYLKHLISENTDGLHRKSGIDINKLSELNGNSTLEVCTRCKKAYMREYICRGSKRTPLTDYDHFTGRFCTVATCKGLLKDTIINFGETPAANTLNSAFAHSEKADLFLSLGSSMTVSPASDMPEIVGAKWQHRVNNEMDKEVQHNLVIVNPRKTELDHLCSLRIFAVIDDVMCGLMKELKMDVPKWYLERFVSVSVQDLENRNDLRKLTVSGVDIEGTDFTLFRDVKLSNNGHKILRVDRQRRLSLDNLMVLANKIMNRSKNEFVFTVPTVSIFSCDETNYNGMVGLEIALSFYGHYHETVLVVQLKEYLNHLSGSDGGIVLKIEFDPITKEWHVANKREQLSDGNVKKLWSNYNINGKESDKVLANPYELRQDDD